MKNIYARSILLLVTCLISLSGFCQRYKWAVPDFVSVQFAGSIGYLSTGAGYNIIPSRARLSFHYGIVPEKKGVLNVVSTKFFFRPSTITIWNRVRLNPADVGVIASFNYIGRNSSTVGESDIKESWWSPQFRVGAGIETSVTYEFPKNYPLHSITGYLEFNTNELYFLRHIVKSEAVHLRNLIIIGTGTRLTF